MKKYVLALDQGTTSSRSVLIADSGEIVSVSQKEFTQHFPKSGWVEHDPVEIWKSQLSTAKSALRKAKVTGKQIAAIGIANQRETAVAWDRETGRPICKAIVWQDRRTAGNCERLKKRSVAKDIVEKTGLVIDAYFSGTKYAWILENVPGAKELVLQKRLAFGTVDSWLIWNLTGGTKAKGAVHATDFSNASRSLVCDTSTGTWDRVLCKALKIPQSTLPTIEDSSDVVAVSEKRIFGSEIPIAGVAGDQHAALFGQQCFQPGMVKNTYGTGCFMLLQTGRKRKPSNNNLLSTTAWALSGRREYALEGSIFVAGAVVQWLRDGLKIIRKSQDVEKLAQEVPDNGGVYLVPAFAGLGAPHWDSFARGSMIGISRGTTDAHVARAALESIAYQTADVLDAMRADSGLRIKSLRVDGGAATNDTLMQFQADILGVEVVRPKVFESTALGAGYLAGLGVGLWADTSDLSEMWQIDRVFQPEMKKTDSKNLRAGWKEAVERSKNWL